MCVGGWGGISTCVCVGGWGGISTCVCVGGWSGISTYPTPPPTHTHMYLKQPGITHTER